MTYYIEYSSEARQDLYDIFLWIIIWYFIK